LEVARIMDNWTLLKNGLVGVIFLKLIRGFIP
jgi:hypothetical protein